MCITTRNNDLRACDTGDISCLTCIGRESCTQYPLSPRSISLSETYNICLECQAIIGSTETCKHKEQYTLMDLSYWFVKGIHHSNASDVPIKNHASFFEQLEKDEAVRKVTLTKIGEILTKTMNFEAAIFPFRSGYNISKCFTEFLSEALLKLQGKERSITTFFNIVDSFKVLVDSLILFNITNKVRPVVDDKEIFEYYGAKLELFKAFIDSL